MSTTSPNDPHSEAACADRLAKLRWGPTGFRCPHCDHRHAYTLRSRPRVRECRRCGRQTSVTSGTLMHRTRLPLSHWMRRGEGIDRDERIPTTSELVNSLQIARSTAWLLNQKTFCAMECRLVGQGVFHLFETQVRRPRRTPPMCPAAPAHIREQHAQHLDGRIRSLRVVCALELVGPRAQVQEVGVPPEEQPRYALRSVGRDASELHAHRGLARWLRVGLHLAHHTVSLRWLPRWLAAHLSSWNSQPREGQWATTALALGPRPLHLLDPWLGMFP
jgi:hypothetical protein